MQPYYHDEASGISIFLGNCRDILPTLDAGPVDLVLTDPPYGFHQSDQKRHKRAANDRHRNSGLPEIMGDREPFDPTWLFIFRRLILFGANHYADKLPASPSWLVWDKRDGSTPDDNADAELIWTNLGGPVRTYRQCWRGFVRANDRLEPAKHVHPTQKPVNLMMWLLDRYTKPGDFVLDPYMGSGPVAQACHILGRRYLGIEIHEPYAEIAAKRLQQSVLPLEAAS